MPLEAPRSSKAPHNGSVGVGEEEEEDGGDDNDSDGSLPPLPRNTNRAHHAHMYRDLVDSSDDDSDGSEENT